ncbi:hypothetical protein NDU88_006566 [Pleurodeles waltl]|uniref:Uncharacterized protein n=1 Tax=Pleurodeles waltl TaxID=8319 RepID=A0AAV7RS90_PLEWA|nr:hypothetical protein NDU88_006566 [Pleurodeles waltl]
MGPPNDPPPPREPPTRGSNASPARPQGRAQRPRNRGAPRDHQFQGAPAAEGTTTGQAPAGRPQARPIREPPNPPAPKAEKRLSAPSHEAQQQQPRVPGMRGLASGRGPKRPPNRPPKRHLVSGPLQPVRGRRSLVTPRRCAADRKLQACLQRHRRNTGRAHLSAAGRHKPWSASISGRADAPSQTAGHPARGALFLPLPAGEMKKKALILAEPHKVTANLPAG